MKSTSKSIVLPVLLALLITPSLSIAGGIVSPSSSLVRLDYSPGWSASLAYRSATRGMEDEDESIVSYDTRQLVARVGISPLDFLHLSAEVGRSKVEQGSTEGEWGLAYGVSITASLYEHAIRSSPSLPRKEAIIIAVDADYRWCESDFGDMTYDWNEYLVIPKVTYVRDLTTLSIAHPKLATGVTAGLGLAFSQVSAELDNSDEDADDELVELNQDRDFGLMVETSARLANSWVVQLKGIFYSSSDDEMSGSVSYYF